MKQCEFCGADMANDAGFCGTCGRLPSRISRHATHISDIPTIHTNSAHDQGDDNQTILSASSQHTLLRTPSGVLRPVTLLPIYDEQKQELEEAEEEEDRRAGLFGMGLPLLEEIANHPTLGQMPVLQGTPQIAQVPVIPTTPQVAPPPVIPTTPQIQGGAPFGPGAMGAPGNPPLLPHVQAPQPLLPPPVRPNTPPKTTGQPPHQFSGCLPLGAIFLATLLIIVLTSIGLSLTAFAPGLSLSGGSTVASGDNLILHGHNFLPNGSVLLTLDGGIALPSAQRPHSTPLIQNYPPLLASTNLAFDASLVATTNNTLTTHSDGTFTATILIRSTWTPGHHTIYATEAVSHRSASLPFTISQVNATGTPTATQSPVPTATPSLTPTATALPPPILSCATPGNLSLGPISELSSQVASANVTLCTTGSGTLTWKASWNQNQASWLQIAQNNGSVQAPNQVQTTISASAVKLNAGTYTAAITFTGIESGTAQTVNVTLTVKAGCVAADPQSLSFSGVEGISNPANAQNISVTNCGLASAWSATIDNGSNWLSLSSNKGTLQSGATKTIAVTASNLNASLKAGTYNDTITFTIGSHTATVKVSLVVQSAPPTIAVSPSSLNAASSPCSNDERGRSICTITLTNQSSTAALTWSDNADGNGVTIQAESTTIPVGGTEQVTIIIPASNCGTQLTITFKAPGNSASVTWNCTPQTPIQ